MVGQRLRDGYRREEDVNKGEVSKKKIHGLVKVNVRANGQDDEQISNQCDGVNEQEKDEEEIFLFPLTANSQKDEIHGRGLVFFPHVSFIKTGEESRIISEVTVYNDRPYPTVCLK